MENNRETSSLQLNDPNLHSWVDSFLDGIILDEVFSITVERAEVRGKTWRCVTVRTKGQVPLSVITHSANKGKSYRNCRSIYDAIDHFVKDPTNK
jgi:hypothetical protein